MVETNGNIALKGSWDAHALPSDTEILTPANRNAPIPTSQPDQNEILQRAKAGWVTKNTYASKGDKAEELIAKGRLQQMQTGATSTTISEAFISRMETEVEAQIKMIRVDIQQNAVQTEQTFEAIATTEADLDAAQLQRNLEARRLILEADEAAVAEADLQEVEAEHEAANATMAHADANGGLAQAQAAAQELSRTAEELEEHQELCDEENADLAEAQERLATIEGRITGFETDLDSLKARANELGEQANALSTELAEYETFHDYLTSEDVSARVANGDMTLEELQANGMPEEVSRRVMGETVEVTRGYDLSDGGNLLVNMRDGLSEAAGNFFETSGLSRLASNFGLAAANTPNNNATPTAPTPETPVAVPSTGTSLG